MSGGARSSIAKPSYTYSITLYFHEAQFSRLYQYAPAVNNDRSLDSMYILLRMPFKVYPVPCFIIFFCQSVCHGPPDIPLS